SAHQPGSIRVSVTPDEGLAMFTLEVLHPVAQTQGEAIAITEAQRPSTLNGLRVGLLWNSKRGGDLALARAGELVRNKYKDVKVVRYDGSYPFDKPLLTKATQECDVFIGSTGD